MPDNQQDATNDFSDTNDDKKKDTTIDKGSAILETIKYGKYTAPNLQLREIDSLSTDMYIRIKAQESETKQQRKTFFITQNTRQKFEASILPINKTIILIYYGILLFIIGLLTSFYRYHLKEVSKYEHFLLAFQRIRIAGSNYQNGFADIVRTSLATEAFIIKEEKVLTKKSKIESAIPGHVGSDIATFLLNKIFENIELKATPKNKAGLPDQTIGDQS